jgi:hypothetical protein
MSKLKRLVALCLVGALAPALPAAAADRAADDAGAKTISDFLSAYAGASALPAFKISKEASSYLVAVDLSALNGATKAMGFAYDPAVMRFRAFQQDDGAWRLELVDFPALSGRMKAPAELGNGDVSVRFEASDFKNTQVIDPKLNWIASVHGGASKAALLEHGPGVDEFIGFENIKVEANSQRGASGLVTTGSELFSGLKFAMDVNPPAPKAQTGRPAQAVHFKGQGEGGEIGVTLSNFEPAPLLDLWRFIVAHPKRADVARDFEALKSVVNAVIADHFTLDEKFKLAKFDLTTQDGATTIEGGEFGLALINGGAETGLAERIAARAIKLPDGIVPPAYAALAPTSFEFGFKATGFDLAAAAKEWFADAKLSGNGPVIAKADQDKVMQKLVAGHPITIDIPPSHIAGPSLDLAFQGRVTIEANQPAGALSITVKNFDKTAEAVQRLDPTSAQQVAPLVIMAKGLGKANPDGSLVWDCVLGHDHIVKVNGLALGKAPF